MKKNKGFSLIELIVVIAIMAVVATGVGVSVFSQSSFKCRQAKDITYSMLQRTKSEALSKSNAWMEICYENNQCVLKSSFDSDRVFGKNVEVSYKYQDGKTSSTLAGPVTIGSGESLVLTFSRGTGAFDTMKEGATQTSDSVSYTPSSKGTEVYCSEIYIKGKNSNKGYTITLHPATGKFEWKKD